MSERSKGKMRPSLVRGSDLRPAETDTKPTDQRAVHGHFAVGNRSAVEARFKHTVKRSLGTSGDGEVGIVASDAKRIYLHVLRSFPSDAPPVRVLVAIHARHAALHAYYTVKAEQAGLTTPEGMALLAVADRQSARAERVLVSAQDMARACANRPVAGQLSKVAQMRADVDARVVEMRASGEIDNE